MLEAIFKKAGLKDVLIVLIGAAAIIGIWRGLWNLMDVYLLPDNFVMSQAISIILGVIILLILSKIR